MGDIAGATTILEFMKQKDMTVNENVFNSLITGLYKSPSCLLDSDRQIF